MRLCSNGIGHRVDEAEFDEPAPQMLVATEPAEPREFIQESVISTGDEGTEQMVLPEEILKAPEDGGGEVAEPEPLMDEFQDQVMSEQERPTEVEEVEPEVEGKLLLLYLVNQTGNSEKDDTVIIILGLITERSYDFLYDYL